MERFYLVLLDLLEVKRGLIPRFVVVIAALFEVILSQHAVFQNEHKPLLTTYEVSRVKL